MREVKYVKFHSGVFIQGIGALGDTLPSPNKTLKLKMFDGGDKLLIEVNGIEAFVPSTNVLVAVYGPKSKKSE